MSIIILGKQGMLGSYIFRFLSQSFDNVIGIDREKLNITSNIDETIQQLRDIIIPKSVVVNCIGIIPQKSKDKKQMILINGQFPLTLALICAEKNSRLIQPSTDCVFEGIMGNYITLSDEYTRDIYGLSKLMGEVNLHNTLVIRTSIIGKDKDNCSLLGWLYKCSKEPNKTIYGYVNHIWNGITCLQYAKEVKKYIENFVSGTVHLYSKINNDATGCTKFYLIGLLNNTYNLKLNIIPKYADDFIDRTLSGTCVDKSFEEQIQEMKEFDENDAENKRNSL